MSFPNNDKTAGCRLDGEGRKEGSKVNGMDLRGVMVGNGESVSLWGWYGSGLGRSVGSVGSLKPFHLSPYPIPLWRKSRTHYFHSFSLNIFLARLGLGSGKGSGLGSGLGSGVLVLAPIGIYIDFTPLTSPSAGRVVEVRRVAEHAGEVGVPVAEVEHIVVFVDGEVPVVFHVIGVDCFRVAIRHGERALPCEAPKKLHSEISTTCIFICVVLLIFH